MENVKRKRGTIRSAITKFILKIEQALQQNPDNVDTLEDHLVELKRKEENLVQLDNEIESSIEENALEEELLTVEEYREKITMTKARVERHLRKSEKEQERNNSTTSSTTSRTGKPTIKLPKLVIDKFYGDSSKWQNFWAQFKSSIHENEDLAKVDKFNYLKSLLDGVAARAITGLPITENTYDTAVDILSKRFGKKDLIINAHMSHLINITPIRDSNNLSALRKTYDDCEIQVRSLESIGVTTGSYSAILCPLLLKVIPADVVLEINRRRNKDDDWEVTEILKLWRDEIEGREKTQQLTAPSEKRNKEEKGYYYKREKSERREFLNATNEKRTGVPSAMALNTAVETKCIFCGKTDHQTERCENRSVKEKREIIQKQGRCFICLRNNHIAKYCRSRIRCQNCDRKHMQTMCELKYPSSRAALLETPVVLSALVPQTSLRSKMLLQTAQVRAIGPKAETVIRCLMDSGSERTFIRKDVSSILSLPVVGTETVKIHTFGQGKPITHTLNRVKVHLKNVQNLEKDLVIEALEVSEISSALIQVTSEELANKLKDLNLQVADELSDQTSSATPITLIIGTDYYWNVVTGQIKRLSDSLVAVNTLFGWSVHGPSPVTAKPGACDVNTMKVCVQISDTEEELVSQKLKQFWDLEAIGITESEDLKNTSEAVVLKLHESNLKYENGKYCVSLPWRQDAKNMLTDNRRLAKIRFKTLVSRFRKDPLFYSRYQDTLHDYLENGVVERVPANDNTDKSKTIGPIHYLPHSAVIKEERCTTKLRVVFDASCKDKGQLSLNECLFPGPNLNPCLFELLIKFRENRIALCADIEKAFLQIELATEDRDVTRFLWTENPFEKDEKMQVETLRLTRVLFGVTSSPFLLAATIKHHLKGYEVEYPKTCKMLDEALYVDDLIGGADDEGNAIERYHESKMIMQAAGMNLRKWSSNSPKLQSLWREEGAEQIGMSTTKMLGKTTVLKVLGIAWDIDNDSFLFETTHLTELLKNRSNSKRCILSMSARIFDPVGMLSPFVIRVKIIFQQLWILGLKWDDPLPEHVEKEWNCWCEELTHMKKIIIPRYYFSETKRAPLKELQLHAFCDSSERAYGAVLYLRAEYLDEEKCTRIVCSKNRVAPIKKITLPRLELMGCLIAARLSKKVMKCLKLKPRCFFWTDSKIAYFWIKNSSKNFKPFVENRVNEIQTLTNPESWRHCPGDQNPADLLSRGVKLQSLTKNQFWWNGPDWLSKPKEDWPQMPEEKRDEHQAQYEWRSRHKNVLQFSCNAVNTKPLIELDGFSSLIKLLRITAWVKRFVHNATNREKKRLQAHLSANEIKNAENHWMKFTQGTSFKNEIEELKGNRSIATDSSIKNLNPFLDDDELLRVGGRLHKSKLSNEQKHPVILPGTSKFTELLILQEHQRVMHGGTADTLAQIRRKYWVTKGRQTVKKINRTCMVCKRFSAKPGIQETAPLPKERIEENPPFTVTGIDFAGPLYVKGEEGTVEKSYIALFTCATTRAIHLELITSMSTENFLLAFQRFTARRGVCNTIISDNAKAFKSAERNLKEIYKKLKDKKIQNYFANRDIKWKYITPLSPWQGGFWERMVRSVKTCLKRVLGKAQLSYEEMATLLCEVEATLNSRPLTYLYNESSEPEPLTPAHFLNSRDLLTIPQIVPAIISTQSTRKTLTKRHKYRRTLLTHIWKRWSSQYLVDLRSAYQLHNTRNGRQFVEGDIVLIADDVKNRMFWKMGVIVCVYYGRDTKVRSCDVRLSDRTIIKRPIQLLYYLEIQDN